MHVNFDNPTINSTVTDSFKPLVVVSLLSDAIMLSSTATVVFQCVQRFSGNDEF